MNDDEEFLQSLRAMFKVEAEEHLSAMSAGLIELEKDLPAAVEAETIETTFREVHSLKGAARAVNMTDIEALCQPLETVMSAWKRHETRPSTAVFDIFYRAIDVMSQVISAPDGETSPAQAQVPALVQQLNRMELEDTVEPEPEPPRPCPAPPAEEAHEPVASAPAPEDIPRPSPHSGHTESNGSLPAHAPASEDIAPAVPRLQLRPVETPAPIPSSAGAAPTAQQNLSEKTSGGQTVRISTAKLDALLLQVEEMLSVKLTAGQRADDLRGVEMTMAQWKKQWSHIDVTIRDFRRSTGQASLSGGEGGLSTPATRLLEFIDWSHDCMRTLESKITLLARQADQDRRDTGARVDYLLEDMKHALMLPCATLLDIFPKLVRDLARDQGKEVEITLRGRDVDMDRRILEELKDPLIHILRNCVDHGLEKPEVRAQWNKAVRGTLSLSVTPVEGSKVEILVRDDGAGIDGNRVKEAAVRLGVLSQADADKLDSQEAVPLIFQSALSTSPIITDLSGRGLGLAIAREKVEKLGGKISVETEVHRGSVFRIVLPVALATFRGIIVEVGTRQFVLPAPSVEAVVRVKHDDIQTIENQETILLKREAIPLVQLADVLELPPVAPKDRAKGYSFAAVLAAGDRRIAFGVDAVLNEQEVLVKPLGKQLRRVRNIAGATVLGSGHVAPVLNVLDLIRSASRSAAAVSRTMPAVGDGELQIKSVLVAEDSITSRMLLKNILESAGYHVRTAVDGVDALTTLKTECFDLVVSDVDMPRMSGFELTAKIRSDKALSEIPVVLVTARGSNEDRERGVDVGANAYIVKSSFDQGNLLDVVQRLL